MPWKQHRLIFQTPSFGIDHLVSAVSLENEHRLALIRYVFLSYDLVHGLCFDIRLRHVLSWQSWKSMLGLSIVRSKVEQFQNIGNLARSRGWEGYQLAVALSDEAGWTEYDFPQTNCYVVWKSGDQLWLKGTVGHLITATEIVHETAFVGIAIVRVMVEMDQSTTSAEDCENTVRR